MRIDDLAEAERLSSQAFLNSDQAHPIPGTPPPTPRGPEQARRWTARTAHVLATDPGGCWVADDGEEMVGFSVSLKRELMWLLSTFAVRPGLQGRGIGKALLAVTADYGKGCLRAMLASSDDPRAVRRYRLAGFHLHPQLAMFGVVDRSELPVVEHVREGSLGDRDLMDSVDRRARGAAHGPDHEVLASTMRLLVTDRPAGSGYAYVDPGGAPALLAATDMRTATRLLWECLATAPPDEQVTLRHVTAANEWAIDVGMAARLDLHHQGYLALRGMKPPAPYLHHGALL